MKKFSFPVPTLINSQSLISSALRDCDIHFSDDANLTLHGDIYFSKNIHIRGTCSIGNNTKVDTGSILHNTNISSDCFIRPYSLIYDCSIGQSNLVGPYAFIRDHTVSAESCILGAHVEIARSNISAFVKISHQSYIGDATIGEHTIVGSGTVFCNFDGSHRQASIVGSRVLLGSGSMIISPVEIGDNAIVAAGSIVTKNIASNYLYLKKLNSD